MPQEELKQRDEGDIFRNTQMKFNESPEQKKLRLKRCLKALSSAGVGKPSAFVGMQVGKPINIEWNRENQGSLVEDCDEEDNSGIQFQKVGRSIMDNDNF